MTTGLLLVDKPLRLTSHDVVARIRRLSGIRRVGHAGTLDPLATGVMLLCLGRAARLLEYLVGLPKSYRAVVRLGATTATYDAESDVVATRPFSHLTPADIEAALSQFKGDIQQQAPAYSAIKKDGQPLYKLARQGEAVEAPTRTVTIHRLQPVAIDLPEVVLDVDCSSGTYIRSLAHDLGQALGCGGYLAGLRRTAVAHFTLAEAVALDALTADNWVTYLQPPDTAVAHLPRLDLPAAAADRLLLGQRLPRELGQPSADLVRVYGPGDIFIGMALARGDVWQPKKMFPAER